MKRWYPDPWEINMLNLQHKNGGIMQKENHKVQLPRQREASYCVRMIRKCLNP